MLDRGASAGRQAPRLPGLLLSKVWAFWRQPTEGSLPYLSSQSGCHSLRFMYIFKMFDCINLRGTNVILLHEYIA